MGVGVAGLAFMFLVLFVTWVNTDASISDLWLPAAAIGSFWVLWIVLHAAIAAVHRWRERREIARLMASDHWAVWQFDANEWAQVVDHAAAEMSPGEGAGIYVGAVYSGALGLVAATAIVVVGLTALAGDESVSVIWWIAGAVLIGLTLVGIWQPLGERRAARRYHARAMRCREPRLWFTEHGIRHESLGYTDLRDLQRVENHTKSSGAITFVVLHTTVYSLGGINTRSTDDWPIDVIVPVSYRAGAATDLVRRYRTALNEPNA